MQAKKLEQNDYSFPVKLFLSLVLLALVPFFYQVIRTYLVANIPNVCGLNIAGHIEWFDLIDETLRAFLIMPLYAIFNKVYSDKKRLKERIAGIAFISFIIYTLFSIIVLIWCSNIVSHMGAEENIPETTAYLRLETVGFIIGLVSSFASVLFVIIGKTKYVYALLLARTVATIAGDLFLIPKFGVNGIAFSNIAVNTLAAIVCIVMLKAENLLPDRFCLTRDLIADYIKIGAFSGGQIFLDNLIYALIVCKMVNEVAEQGNYWVANNVIWGLMLIPINALSEIVRKDCTDKIAKKKLVSYSIICCGTFVIWAVFLIFLNPFLKIIMGITNYTEISKIIYVVIPFYITYAISQVISSIFIGYGKTWCNLIISLCVNLVYYPIVYCMVLRGIFTPSIIFICFMFGAGMALNMLISIGLFIKIKKNL